MSIFDEQHEMFRATVRSFVEREVVPHVEEWEAIGGGTSEIMREIIAKHLLS